MIATSAVPFVGRWHLPDAVQLALLLEASAPKAGNVHPAASFGDMDFTHFVASAVAVRESFAALERDPQRPIGQLILDAVRAMQEATSRNTILGSLLLFGPLTKAFSASSGCSRDSLRAVLTQLTPADSQAVYRAIRLAKPGGLGNREADDVAGVAPQNLMDAMSQVAEFDAVARQYTTAFLDIFERSLPWLEEALQAAADVPDAICRLQLRWLAHEPDGLIVRKAGKEAAQRVQVAAQRTWDTCRLHVSRYVDQAAYQDFDAMLRSDGHRLNPGTTADLIAATLLVKLLGTR